MLDTDINEVAKIGDEENYRGESKGADRGLRNVNYDDFLPYRNNMIL